jgi:hypothetical protein
MSAAGRCVLRPYTPADLERVLALFARSVHGLAGNAYDLRQPAAWASAEPDRGRWAARPFFVSQGFVMVTAQSVRRDAVTLHNYRMRMSLCAPASRAAPGATVFGVKKIRGDLSLP